MMSFTPGQRWFSAAEPELGLGTVMRLAGRSVQIVFTGSGTIRQYAINAAPLIRASFRIGDRIRVEGSELQIDRVEERAALLHYHCQARIVNEGELDAEQPVSQADSRLLSGRIDNNQQFELRRECLERRAIARQNPGWGVLGARIDLIAHQLAVAQIADDRRPVRLLLADEVGLGKTIEACLIAAQQLATGRANRVLVLTPESLVNQWFIELRRRFNLAFAIFDEERCESIELTEPKANPFVDEQCIIASIDWLASHEKRMRQLLAADWDLLLVDEAHHLLWTQDFASPGYQLVDALAKKTPGVLLLTATPEQLGRGGHFARLRLLDPARYTDLQSYIEQADHYVALSQLAGRLLDNTALTTADMEQLAKLFPDQSEQLASQLAAIAGGDQNTRDQLLNDLIDRHGTGRVMIRNRRAAVGGFPQRIAHLQVLPAQQDSELLGTLRAEFAFETGDLDTEPVHDYTRDPRTDWLLATLDKIAPAKALLLCQSRAKVQALEEALRLRSGINVARFHEDMNLLQRDRNAAYFADAEGARLLLASEVGAEGRNFQFAQHLILWDLPLHPDMLEQRIGRLDRIGQPGDVNIHVAAVEGSAQEVLLRWYHEGLNAFTDIVPDGSDMLRRFVDDIIQLANSDFSAREPRLAELISQSKLAHQELSALIANGRDRLLELASRRGSENNRLLAALQQDDQQASDDDFFVRLLEQFGVQHEPLSEHVFLLDPEHIVIDGFEDFKNGPRQATSDRVTGLSRDDLLYLRDDHPMLLSAQEMLLSSETGNAAFLIDDVLPPRTALLEAVYVLECIAPAALNVGRFLPTMPIRVAIDNRLQLREAFEPNERSRLRAGDRAFDLAPLRKVLDKLIPPLLEAAHSAASDKAQSIQQRAAIDSAKAYQHELERLRALAKINDAIKPTEILMLADEADMLQETLPKARLRLDALRLVVSADFLGLRSR